MAVRAAHTLAASMNSGFFASTPTDFLACESRAGNLLSEMVAHTYQSFMISVKKNFSPPATGPPGGPLARIRTDGYTGTADMQTYRKFLFHFPVRRALHS
jgi:hypothetical protein